MPAIPPPESWEVALPPYGIRSPKPTAPANKIATILQRVGQDVTTALEEFGLPPVITAAVVVASSAAARDAYWGIPASVAAQKSLQDRAATTERIDLGMTERYFAPFDAVTNPSGAPVAGWYPFSGRLPYLRMTVAKNIANGVDTVVGATAPDTQYTEISDLYNMHSPASTPTRIYPKVAGRYRATANVSWASNTNGLRIIAFRKNGVTLNSSRLGSLPTTDSVVSSFISLEDNFNGTTDYLEMSAFQNVGGALTLFADVQVNFVAVS